MMKPYKILTTVLMTIILTACSTSAVTTTPSNPVAEVTTTSSLVETSMSGIVTFADPVLEAMIRSAMGKPEGEITLAEAQGVTRMDLTDSLQRQLSEFTPITNLDGLEAFTNLESLDLSQKRRDRHLPSGRAHQTNRLIPGWQSRHGCRTSGQINQP